MTLRIPLLLILMTALWPLVAQADDPANAPIPASPIPASPVSASPISASPGSASPVSASEVSQADLIFHRRPVIIFADSAEDPTYLRQMDMLTRYAADLAERDVILITDTDPGHPSELRQQLRPRGFSLVIMDKDWKSAIRKPLPWDGREILRSIDKMPLVRAEALERYPAGR